MITERRMMAAIDKIYGTHEQSKELREWLTKNKPEFLPSMYPHEDYPEDNCTISNFSEDEDNWLLENCPLEWVTDYIKEQYGMED